MVKHSTLFHSTIGAALLSTLLLSTSAQAGLLGGGGAAGGLGGGLSGNFAPSNVGIGGQASGEASRHGALLPRGENAASKVGDTTQAGKDAGQSAASKAAESKAAATDGARDKAGMVQERAGKVGGNASASGSGQTSRSDRSVNAEASAQGGVTR